MERTDRGFRKKAIKAPRILNEPIDYNKPCSFSRGLKILTREISFVFISGTASVNNKGRTVFSGDFEAQARRTFKNLTALLGSSGVTWNDVIKTTCYLKDMKYYDIFNKIRNQFYKQRKVRIFPASTCIEANLCRPDLLVEIELIAIRKALS
jgi:2-iminobutanoate/2-iminopropanoate deaminase